jgi:hypothetical protein
MFHEVVRKARNVDARDVRCVLDVIRHHRRWQCRQRNYRYLSLPTDRLDNVRTGHLRHD